MAPRKQVPAPRSGRYSYSRCMDELSDYLARKGRGSALEAAGVLGMSKSQFSKRLSDTEARFTIEQLGALAEWASDPQTGESAPLGWPFIPWAIGREAFRKK